MRQLSKYSFANAKIRAMLSELLSPSVFSRLAESKDVYEFFEILKNTSYNGIVSQFNFETNDVKYLEKLLILNDIHIYKKTVNSLHGKTEKELIGLLLQRYEIEELKVMLRIWHKKEAINVEDYILGEKIGYDIDFRKILSAVSIEEVMILLEKTPYKKAILEGRNKFKEKDSVFYLEASLDIDYYKRLHEAIDKLSPVDKKVAKKILGITIDMENIRWLLRLRKYHAMGIADILEWVVPGGDKINKDIIRHSYTTDGLAKVVESVAHGPYTKIKDLVTQNIHLIEGLLHEILFSEIKKILSGFPFTVGTIVSYLILKYKETRNIVSLFYAKEYKLQKEEFQPLVNLNL